MGVFSMPSLGADMEAGTLVEWMIKPGDTVKRGDVVAVVETQKGAIEIETFEPGTVQGLKAELGQELPVGAPLALILGEGESADERAGEEEDRQSVEEAALKTQDVAPEADHPEPKTSIKPPPPSIPEARQPQISAEDTHRLRASPAARRLASETGVDLTSVSGSGPQGAIQLRDVEGALTTANAPVRFSKPGAPMAEMRKAIAAAMTRSKQEVPHLYVTQTIDLQPAIDWLADHNADRSPAERILMGALFVRAATLAAGKVPIVNGQWSNGDYQRHDAVHAGVAVALRGGGLVAPAILDAQTKTLDGIMAAMRDLVSRARSGRLRSSEMTRGTITISALGEAGAEAMTGVIFPPQAALLCLGAPQKRPWVVDEAIEVRQTVQAALSLDHRVGDGRQASAFLSAFEAALTKPEAL